MSKSRTSLRIPWRSLVLACTQKVCHRKWETFLFWEENAQPLAASCYDVQKSFSGLGVSGCMCILQVQWHTFIFSPVFWELLRLTKLSGNNSMLKNCLPFRVLHLENKSGRKKTVNQEHFGLLKNKVSVNLVRRGDYRNDLSFSIIFSSFSTPFPPLLMWKTEIKRNGKKWPQRQKCLV